MTFNIAIIATVLLIYLLTHFGNRKKQTKDTLFLIITFVLLFAIVALRDYTVGNDTISYINLYKNSAQIITNNSTYFEQGYIFLNNILRNIGLTPRVFLVVLSAIYYVSLYAFIKKNSKNYLFSILLFINLLFFYQSMTMMRQFLALSVVITLGYKYIKEKKPLKYVISILIAATFHSSALIALLLYPLHRLKHTKKISVLLLTGSIIVTILLPSIYTITASILNKNAYYTSMIGTFKIGNLISALLNMSILLYSLHLTKNTSMKENESLNILLMSACILLISTNMAVLSRAAQYFEIFTIIYLPNIIENAHVKSKVFTEAIVISVIIIYASTIMIYRPEWNTAFDYIPCFSDKSTSSCFDG